VSAIESRDPNGRITFGIVVPVRLLIVWFRYDYHIGSDLEGILTDQVVRQFTAI
jgi:hypothetical protein